MEKVTVASSLGGGTQRCSMEEFCNSHETSLCGRVVVLGFFV